MLPISVCIIAKNEEKYIGECLRRLSKYDWEIVVVDTGSSDHTVEIALTYTPNVFHFDWINDFSAARNYSISKASNGYILVIDCDEYLEDPSTLLANTLNNISSLLPPGKIGMINCKNSINDFSNSSAKYMDSFTHEQIARVFHKDYTCYQGPIHEQLVSRDNSPLHFISLPLCFYHVGYSSLEVRSQKANRNISMLESSIQADGADAYLYFQLGQTYFGIFDYENALLYFKLALTIDLNEKESYVQTLVESYGYCLLYLKKHEMALQLEEVYSIFSKRADFVFLMGLIYMNNAMFDKAIDEFKKSTTILNYSVDGVNSYRAYYNIGVIYECTNNLEKARFYYSKCKNYTPALERLALLIENT